jgi:hypothetical protein
MEEQSATMEPGAATDPAAALASGAVAGAEAGSVEELLAAADSAWASAADLHAGGDVEGWRSALEEAFASQRRAEARLTQDPATFSFLRPAYEKLLAELREGVTSPEAAFTELDASAEELARAAAAHPANGKHYEMPIDPDDPLVAKYLALFQEGRRREFLAEAFSRSSVKQIQVEIWPAGCRISGGSGHQRIQGGRLRARAVASGSS